MSPKIHVHLEVQDVILFENRASRSIEAGEIQSSSIRWALNLVTGVLVGGSKAAPNTETWRQEGHAVLEAGSAAACPQTKACQGLLARGRG